MSRLALPLPADLRAQCLAPSLAFLAKAVTVAELSQAAVQYELALGVCDARGSRLVDRVDATNAALIELDKRLPKARGDKRWYDFKSW